VTDPFGAIRVFAIADREVLGPALLERARVALAAVPQARRSALALIYRDTRAAASDRRDMALELRALTRDLGVRYVVHGDPILAEAAAADGLHLPSRAPTAPHPSLPFGRSCHSEADLAAAFEAGAAWAFLSPFRATASHPEVPALGAAAWARIAGPFCAQGRRVVALGGLDAASTPEAVRAGASAVAAIRAAFDGGLTAMLEAAMSDLPRP
jgi:thiamine monophosphate synthase